MNAVNADAVVSAESIESVPPFSNAFCANGNVAENLEAGVSVNSIVCDVKTDEAVPSTSGDKKLENKEGTKEANQGELCYDVVNNEEMEDVLSDDFELQEDSQCDYGNSVQFKLIFQEVLTKTHFIA